MRKSHLLHRHCSPRDSSCDCGRMGVARRTEMEGERLHLIDPIITISSFGAKQSRVSSILGGRQR